MVAGVAVGAAVVDVAAVVGRLVGARIDWARLEAFLPDGVSAELGRSALASSFVAMLELARQGRVDIRQEGIFAPIFLRAADSAHENTDRVEAGA